MLKTLEIRDEIRSSLETLCIHYHLGNIVARPEPLSGGYLHKLWRVETQEGSFVSLRSSTPLSWKNEAWQVASNKLSPLEPLFAKPGFRQSFPMPTMAALSPRWMTPLTYSILL